MKILGYTITPNGTKILTHIKDARLDKLETRAQAIEYVKAQPEYEGFEAMFEKDKHLIAKAQRFHNTPDSPERRALLKAIAARQKEFETMQAEHEATNPVYLTPAYAVLVDTETADAIEADFKNNEHVALDVDADGKGVKHSMILNEYMGKRYRMPGTNTWHMVEHPDETPPSGAVFTVPDNVEREAINAKRINGLTPEARDAEQAAAIEMAENAFVRAHTLADALSGTEAEKSKQAAKDALTAAKKAIKASYKV